MSTTQVLCKELMNGSELFQLTDRLRDVSSYFAMAHTPELKAARRAFRLAENGRNQLVWFPTGYPWTFLLQVKGQTYRWNLISQLPDVIVEHDLHPDLLEIENAVDWTRQETKRMIDEGSRVLLEQGEAMRELQRLALPLKLAGVQANNWLQDYPVQLARFQVAYSEHLAALERQNRAAATMQLAVANLFLPGRRGRYEERLEDSLTDARIAIGECKRLPQRVLALCQELQAGENIKA